MKLPSWVKEDLTSSQIERFEKGEPIEYILGSISFYDCVFQVDKRALIPRQETEIMVDLICQKKPRGVLLDLCTGTGCVGISLKKKFPELEVFLSDLSEDALELAKINARKNGVEVTFLHGDLLEPFKGKRADWVVCNPPYISEDDYKTLDPSVKDYEPKLALVGGKKGFEFYERLAKELPSYLNEGGRVFLEIGHDQGAVIQEIFTGKEWKDKMVIKDFSKKDRFFYAKY